MEKCLPGVTKTKSCIINFRNLFLKPSSWTIDQKYKGNGQKSVLAIVFICCFILQTVFVFELLLLIFNKTPILPLFVNMGRLVFMANTKNMAIIAIMKYYDMASNMVYMGVCSKISKKVDQPQNSL